MRAAWSSEPTRACLRDEAGRRGAITLDCDCDLTIDEAVVAVPAVSLHGQKAALDQTRELDARRRRGDAGPARELAGR